MPAAFLKSQRSLRRRGWTPAPDNAGGTDMSRLDREQIDRLDALMNERWAREFREIRSMLASLGEERQRAVFAERAATATDEGLLQTLAGVDDPLIRQNLQDVRDIVAARQRIAQGSYGECTDCGESVGHERLLAYPTAKRCIGCQREHERRKAAAEGRSGPR
jgi:RNA polymerase-binding transcription factor DksA